MSKQFGGLWPAMVTPVAADGSPNLAVCEQLVELFVREGLDGIYLLGSTGQWPLFHLDERKAIAAAVVRASAGRIPVMVHVGSVSTADAEELSKHAEQIGADAVSAVAPIYYKCPQTALFEHYRRIASASSLPFFAYHLSSTSTSDINPREYVDRLLALPNITGMKITDHDLYPFGLIHGFAGERLQLFSGADEMMCHAVLGGAVGAIGTFYNVWGNASQAARKATVSGDIATGRAFMLRLQRAIYEAKERGMWTFLQAAIKQKYNIDVGVPRAPLGLADQPWPDGEVKRIVALVDEAGDLN